MLFGVRTLRDYHYGEVVLADFASDAISESAASGAASALTSVAVSSSAPAAAPVEVGGVVDVSPGRVVAIVVSTATGDDVESASVTIDFVVISDPAVVVELSGAAVVAEVVGAVVTTSEDAEVEGGGGAASSKEFIGKMCKSVVVL